MVSKDLFLRINNLHVAYSGGAEVLRGASFSVERGRLISLVGSNDAGKTTLLRAISGMLKYHNGILTGGDIEFKGKKINNLSPLQIIREGIVHILEGQREFPSLSIEENLSLGAVARQGKPSRAGIDLIYDYFPALAPRKKIPVSDCGIAELQMLAIGRALMAQPEIILLDEPYQRMAPILAHELFSIIRRITLEKGITFIFVERNPGISFEISDKVFSVVNGKIFSDNNGKLHSSGSIRLYQ
jgi:branched-chain amino acid transport system ATP-binding protein